MALKKLRPVSENGRSFSTRRVPSIPRTPVFVVPLAPILPSPSRRPQRVLRRTRAHHGRIVDPKVDPISTTPIMPPARGLTQVRVSDNGRYLVGDDGAPFFYLADTAWGLFYNASFEDAVHYLRVRRDQGF